MKKSGILIIIGSFFLLGLFLYPLWNIMLEAPQYPNPLGMDIYITGIEGVKEFDIDIIDNLNHYIGMKTIPKNEEMWQFEIFPIVIIGMFLLALILGVLVFFNKLNHKWILGWLILMSILGVLGMYNFNEWLIDYGGNLDPNAIMSFTDEFGNPMTYKPPLFGHQKMLNFDVDSYPAKGAYLMFVGLILIAIAYLVSFRSSKKAA